MRNGKELGTKLEGRIRKPAGIIWNISTTKRAIKRAKRARYRSLITGA
jgi:hypothetical protein